MSPIHVIFISAVNIILKSKEWTFAYLKTFYVYFDIIGTRIFRAVMHVLLSFLFLDIKSNLAHPTSWLFKPKSQVSILSCNIIYQHFIPPACNQTHTDQIWMHLINQKRCKWLFKKKRIMSEIITWCFNSGVYLGFNHAKLFMFLFMF